MKVVRDDVVYVQLNDLGFLFNQNFELPIIVFEKVFGGKNGALIVTDSNRYDFMEFQGKEFVDYFTSQSINSFMLDYDKLKNLTMAELMDYGQRLSERRNERANYFNSLSQEERKENMDIVFECEQLMFKMHSLADYVHYRNGNLEIPFLDGIKNSESEENIEEKKGIKQKIKSLFGKK